MHEVTLRRWDDPRTWQAVCSCGWRARWGHTSREPARRDGVQHAAEDVQVEPFTGGAGWMMPGI